MFHRIDDMYALPGPRFFQMAWRIAAYDGMMARRIEAQNHKPDPAPTQQRRPPAAGRVERAVIPRAAKDALIVPASALALMYPDLVERVDAPQKSPET